MDNINFNSITEVMNVIYDNLQNIEPPAPGIFNISGGVTMDGAPFTPEVMIMIMAGAPIFLFGGGLLMRSFISTASLEPVFDDDSSDVSVNFSDSDKHLLHSMAVTESDDDSSQDSWNKFEFPKYDF